jgi:hypothetical protein
MLGTKAYEGCRARRAKRLREGAAPPALSESAPR